MRSGSEPVFECGQAVQSGRVQHRRREHRCLQCDRQQYRAGTAQSVDVSDLPPTQIGNWASVTCSAGAGNNCGTASTSGSIGANIIAADSSLTFTYTGTIPAGTTSTIVNTATVTGSGCAAGCTAAHVLAPANPATAGTLTISKRASLAAYTPTGGALQLRHRDQQRDQHCGGWRNSH